MKYMFYGCLILFLEIIWKLSNGNNIDKKFKNKII